MKYVFKNRGNLILVAVFDAMGYFLFRLFRRAGHSPPPFHHILVVRLDHLGDVLSSLGIPKAIKENFPNCKITFLTSSWASPLLLNNPFVDDVMVFDAPWFAKSRYAKDRQALGLGKLIPELRKRNIDMVLGLRGDLRENIIFWLAGIGRRVGYGITGGGFLLTQEVPYEKGAHESAHLFRLLSVLGIKPQTLVPHIYFSEREIAEFEKRIPAPGLPSDRRWVGFQVGAGAEAKEWPQENADVFLGDFGKRFKDYQIVLVGSDEKKASEILSAHPRLSFVNLVNQTSLRELCLLIKKFKCFIGHDSGPTHLAAALGIRTVFLYSGTNLFEQWRPLAEEAVVLRTPVPCSPCGLEICNVSGHFCMTGISPADVISALEKSCLNTR